MRQSGQWLGREARVSTEPGAWKILSFSETEGRRGGEGVGAGGADVKRCVGNGAGRHPPRPTRESQRRASFLTPRGRQRWAGAGREGGCQSLTDRFSALRPEGASAFGDQPPGFTNEKKAPEGLRSLSKVTYQVSDRAGAGRGVSHQLWPVSFCSKSSLLFYFIVVRTLNVRSTLVTSFEVHEALPSTPGTVLYIARL